MFDRDEALQLFDYDRWANTRTLQQLARLSAPLPAAERLMAHIVGALEVWTERTVGSMRGRAGARSSSGRTRASSTAKCGS